MPLGAIFGAVLFGLLCPLWATRLLSWPWAPVQAIGVLLWPLGIATALALLQRRRWARWAGVGEALGLTVLAGLFVFRLPAPWIGDYLLFLGGLTAAGLLAAPATGDPARRTAGPDATAVPPRPRAGRVTAGIALVAGAGLLLTVVWAIGAGVPVGTRALPGGWEPSKVDWLDFGPALERARAEDKPVLVDFFAEWCGPCHKMDGITFRHPEVARILNEDILAARVDSEETEERHGYSGYDLAERYEIASYPTVALLDAGGKVISRRSGYLGPREFLSWLDEALALAESGHSKRFA